MGLGPRLVNFLEKMYENTSIRVRVDGQLGAATRYKRGVRQGCPTSPLLFNIFYDDILAHQQPVLVEGLASGVRGLMFADDTVLLAETRQELVEKLGVIKAWTDENSMEVNPSKCGLMEITTDQSAPHLEPIPFSGESIPVVSEYTYLGVELNRKLDLSQSAMYRVRRGQETLATIRPTLASNRVPLAYKRMLVHNVLIPRITFGSEVFGMSRKRIQPLKTILDNALKCIYKNSNFCRLRGYEELGLTDLYVSSSMARARGLSKYRESRGVIKELIASSTSFKSRKPTWTKLSVKWLKTMKLDATAEPGAMQAAVKQERQTKLARSDTSKASAFAKKHGIRNARLLLEAEFKQLLSSCGISAMIRIRTSSFRFTDSLVRTGVLSADWHHRCICCTESVVEDAWHLLIECPVFSQHRESSVSLLQNSLDGIVDNSRKIAVLSRLLGGELVASRMKRTGEEIGTVNLLAKIIPLRNALIAERRVPLVSASHN